MDLLIKYRNYLLSIAAFLVLTAVSFNLSQGEVSSILSDYPLLMMGLVLLGILLVFSYLKIEKHRITSLTDSIRDNNNSSEKGFTELVKTLTTQQKKVYDLILSGKSNKEIMSELFIERSTLKSHINQIYKKLEINSRRELKSRYQG